MPPLDDHLFKDPALTGDIAIAIIRFTQMVGMHTTHHREMRQTSVFDINHCNLLCCLYFSSLIQNATVGQLVMQGNPFEASVLDFILQSTYMRQHVEARNKRFWWTIAIGAIMSITPFLLHQIKTRR